MAHIPTFCDACSTSALCLASAIQNGSAACNSCGAEARPIPGASYAAADVQLYTELAAAVQKAQITRLSAVQLLSQASANARGTPGQLLDYLAATIPALSVFETYSRSDRVHKINAMLATLLLAIGTGRSSEPPAPSAATEAREVS